MLSVGLTGGIGSGKSLVADIFFRLGVPVYISDLKAKELMNSNSELISALKQEFGSDIYNGTELNRKALADIIFNSEQKLKRVNEIVHPYVREDFLKWTNEHSDSNYIINESAIVFSSGLYKALDKVICVSSPLELRVKRVIKRDNSNRESVEKIAARQLSDAERIEKSDYILYNNEEELLVPQIIKLHQILIQLAL